MFWCVNDSYFLDFLESVQLIASAGSHNIILAIYLSRQSGPGALWVLKFSPDYLVMCASSFGRFKADLYSPESSEPPG